jgi:hypothetical protein
VYRVTATKLQVVLGGECGSSESLQARPEQLRDAPRDDDGGDESTSQEQEQQKAKRRKKAPTSPAAEP